MAESEFAARFPTTRWSQVVAAGDSKSAAAWEALAALCVAYWYPLYAFIRRKGHDPDAALDLTQGYFAGLLERGAVAAANPSKGRFRSFLLTDCGFFLADQGDRDRAVKRGGGTSPVSIDARGAEDRFLIEPAHDDTAERLFDRDWALALINRVFDRLATDYTAAGRGDLFRRLKSILTSDPDAPAYSALAAELNTTEGSLRVALHRVRARFAAELRAEIAATLDRADPAEVDAELRDLFQLLGR